MPNRARPRLSPGERAAFEAALQTLAEYQRRATLDKYVKISEAYDAGMTTRQIGAVFDVTSDTATRWKDMGEEERIRRGSIPPPA